MVNLTNKVKVLMILLLGVAGLSTYAYINQLIYGLGVTAMNRPVFWGMYIVNFVFFVGVSAGGIAVASLVYLGGVEKFKPIGKIAEVIAIISLLMAMLSILFDLGRPERLLNLVIYAQPFSPLVWDFVVLNIYLVLCVGMLWLSIKNNQKWLKIISYISIPTFVLVHSITAWIFGLMKARPEWHSSILAPLFIASALVSGLGLVIMAIIFGRWAMNLKIENDVIIGLGKYFRFLLPILFFLLFSEFLTITYADVPREISTFNELVAGKFAMFFWADMILGILIPFLLSVSPISKTVPGVSLIAILSHFGVLFERIDIILPTFFHHPLIPGTVNYFPTIVEIAITAGAYTWGALLFLIAFSITPLKKEVA